MISVHNLNQLIYRVGAVSRGKRPRPLFLRLPLGLCFPRRRTETCRFHRSDLHDQTSAGLRCTLSEPLEQREPDYSRQSVRPKLDNRRAELLRDYNER